MTIRTERTEAITRTLREVEDDAREDERERIADSIMVEPVHVNEEVSGYSLRVLDGWSVGWFPTRDAACEAGNAMKSALRAQRRAAPPVVKNRAAVVAVLNSAGEVLAVSHLKHGGFALPGGKVEQDEPPLLAAARELREEVGLEVDHLHWAFRGPSTFDTERMVDVFVATVWRGMPCAVESDTEIRWTRIEDLAAQSTPLAPFYRRHADDFARAFERLGVVTRATT